MESRDVEKPTVKPGHLLIVEHEGHTRDYLREAFADDAFHVDCAGTRDQVLQLMDSQEYEVAITDIRFERDSDGIDILEDIRSRSPETDVIAIGGRTSVDTAIRVWRAGALEYFTKPVDVPRLREKVLECLRWNGATQEGIFGTIRRHCCLSEGECRVLQQALTGLPNRVIARRLELAEGTVKNHLTQVFKKCGVANRHELLAKFRTPRG
jgi:DNA-binding NarL/FixJ family response regulator